MHLWPKSISHYPSVLTYTFGNWRKAHIIEYIIIYKSTTAFMHNINMYFLTKLQKCMWPKVYIKLRTALIQNLNNEHVLLKILIYKLTKAFMHNKHVLPT